jgi:probable DNA repair protein
MGVTGAEETDAWLRQGGAVVAASERAARSLSVAFNRTRLHEGLKAWPSPHIHDWDSFIRAAWAERACDGRLLLNSTQEQAVWAGLAAADGRMATLLEGPRHRLARLAMDAHDLLCGYAPELLRTAARAGWQNDAGAFSRWLAAFDETCRTDGLVSPARLPLELLQMLRDPELGSQKPARKPLLLVGFDRLLPTQKAVLDAWGSWQEAAPASPAGGASEARFHSAAGEQAELEACALWCESRLAADPHTRILVVTQNASQRRGRIERALHRLSPAGAPPLFEFTLGVPLASVSLPRAALLLLRWLSGPLAEHEIDWLLSTGYAAAGTAETSAVQACMRSLRRRSLQQPSWTLPAFLAAIPVPSDGGPAAAWRDRIAGAAQRLKDQARSTQLPLNWAEIVPQVLEDAAWPGASQLASVEFQAAQRFRQAIETAGSLGFDGRRVPWKDFVSSITRTLEETLFAPESQDAPIQIAGPAESAGLTADAIWFLGATEDAWPAGGATHPLIPIEVQRQARMPHSAPQLDWDLGLAITARLMSSALQVHFSYAKQVDAAETRPSRLVSLIAAAPQPLPAELQASPAPPVLTVPFQDFSQIPYLPGPVSGGAAVLTFQSQCAFKAFANARLDAKSWEAAQPGLTPAQRGSLLHQVLHAVWGGSPHGIRTHADLSKMAERPAWVAAHVARVFASSLPAGIAARMPGRYLELEQQRLTRLVAQWLDYDEARIPFEVAETEVCRSVQIEGLSFQVRLDRLDRLNDGSVLVIDYKTGDVKPKVWDLPRPDDVQLPLYAGFALGENEDLGGLVFAKVRAGDLEFAGCVGAPAATLLAGLKSSSSLAKNALTGEQLIDWREEIERLAQDFLTGRAEVDPRDPPATCVRCGLHTLCRINEIRSTGEDEESDGSGFAEAIDG